MASGFNSGMDLMPEMVVNPLAGIVPAVASTMYFNTVPAVKIAIFISSYYMVVGAAAHPTMLSGTI